MQLQSSLPRNVASPPHPYNLHHQGCPILPLLLSTTSLYTMRDQPRKSFRHSLRSLILSNDRSSSSSQPAGPALAASALPPTAIALPTAIDSTDIRHGVSTDEQGHPQPPKASVFSMSFRKKQPKSTSTFGSRPSSPKPGVDVHLQQSTVRGESNSNNNQAMALSNDHTSNCNNPIV